MPTMPLEKAGQERRKTEKDVHDQHRQGGVYLVLRWVKAGVPELASTFISDGIRFEEKYSGSALAIANALVLIGPL